MKYWPYGSSTKQTMFLNQLEDLFEYVQVRQHAGVLVVASKVHPPSTAMFAVVDGMPEVGCCWCCCTCEWMLRCWGVGHMHCHRVLFPAAGRRGGVQRSAGAASGQGHRGSALSGCRASIVLVELVSARVHAFRLCLRDRFVALSTALVCFPIDTVPCCHALKFSVYLCVCCVFSAFCVRTTTNHYHQSLTAINRGRPWCPASDSRS